MALEERNGFSTGLYIVTLALASCANALDTGCNFRPAQKVIFDVLKGSQHRYRWFLHVRGVAVRLQDSTTLMEPSGRTSLQASAVSYTGLVRATPNVAGRCSLGFAGVFTGEKWNFGLHPVHDGRTGLSHLAAKRDAIHASHVGGNEIHSHARPCGRGPAGEVREGPCWAIGSLAQQGHGGHQGASASCRTHLMDGGNIAQSTMGGCHFLPGPAREAEWHRLGHRSSKTIKSPRHQAQGSSLHGQAVGTVQTMAGDLPQSSLVAPFPQVQVGCQHVPEGNNSHRRKPLGARRHLAHQQWKPWPTPLRRRMPISWTSKTAGRSQAHRASLRPSQSWSPSKLGPRSCHHARWNSRSKATAWWP